MLWTAMLSSLKNRLHSGSPLTPQRWSISATTAFDHRSPRHGRSCAEPRRRTRARRGPTRRFGAHRRPAQQLIERQVVAVVRIAHDLIQSCARLQDFCLAVASGEGEILTIACYPVHLERSLAAMLGDFRPIMPRVRLDLSRVRHDGRRDLGRSLFDEPRAGEIELAMGPRQPASDRRGGRSWALPSSVRVPPRLTSVSDAVGSHGILGACGRAEGGQVSDAPA
jgi:hypothetical protein